MCSSTFSLTSTLGGGWVANATSRSLYPRKEPVPIVLEAGLAAGPVWMGAENLATHLNSIPGPSSPQRVAIPTELSLPISYLMW